MKIGFFITARLKSSRLKQKILLDLNGRTVLDRVIDRAKSVMGVDGVVLCTSTNPQDSLLFDFALSNGIKFFAGSENDVLARLLGAADYYGFDAFVSITADNPMLSIHSSSIMVDLYRTVGYDFLYSSGLPMGCNTTLIDVKALRIVNFIKKQSDTEIWGPFINRPDFFNVAEIRILNSPISAEYRITIDYPEDYKLLRKIYDQFQSTHVPNLINVLEMLAKSEELRSINVMHQQQMLSSAAIESINMQFNKSKRRASKYASEIKKILISSKELIQISL